MPIDSKPQIIKTVEALENRYTDDGLNTQTFPISDAVDSDRLDCLAIAVNYWTEQMGQDADRRISQRNDRLLAEELKAWDDAARLSLFRNKVALAPEPAGITPSSDKAEMEMLFSFQSCSLPSPVQEATSPPGGRPAQRRSCFGQKGLTLRK